MMSIWLLCVFLNQILDGRGEKDRKGSGLFLTHAQLTKTVQKSNEPMISN